MFEKKMNIDRRNDQKCSKEKIFDEMFKANNFKIPKLAKVAIDRVSDQELLNMSEQFNKINELVTDLQTSQSKLMKSIYCLQASQTQLIESFDVFKKELDSKFQLLFENSDSL